MNLKRGAVLAWNYWRIGILSDYRAAFWEAAWHALRRGQIEAIFGMGFVAWRLIHLRKRLWAESKTRPFTRRSNTRPKLEQQFLRIGLPSPRQCPLFARIGPTPGRLTRSPDAGGASQFRYLTSATPREYELRKTAF